MLTVLMLLLAVVPLVMGLSLSKRTHSNSVKPIDIGIVFTWVVFLYAFLPLVGIWLSSQGIGTLADQRLGGVHPDSAIVEATAQSYAAFMLGFAVVYAVTRRTNFRQLTITQPPTLADLRNILLLAVFVKLASAALLIGFSSNSSGSYIGTYTALVGQPLLLRQLAGVLSATDFAASILVIFVIVAYNDKLWQFLFVILIVNVCISVVGGGSRTNAFLYAFAFFVSRSCYDRRLNSRVLILYGVIGVALFLIAGLIRSSFNSSDGSLILQVLQDGEFLSLFYTSMDVLMRTSGVELDALKPGLYLVDVLRLIPQQIVGGLKTDPATLYVSTFYPEFGEAGGGLAFGAIAESSIGFGWPEALVRGALVGWLYSSIASRCLGENFSVIRGFIYVWFVVVSYQSIRDTTFSTVPRFIIQVIPMLVFLRFTGTLAAKRKLWRKPLTLSNDRNI